MARLLLIETSLPKYLWTYTVMHATYIQNCCYSQHTNNTPNGLITNLQRNVARICIMKLFFSHVYNTM